MLKLYTNAETAARLNIKPNTLEIWRHYGKGPRFLKLGAGKQAPIRYAEADIVAWLEECAFSSTSAYSPHGQASSKHDNRSSSGVSE